MGCTLDCTDGGSRTKKKALSLKARKLRIELLSSNLQALAKHKVNESARTHEMSQPSAAPSAMSVHDSGMSSLTWPR